MKTEHDSDTLFQALADIKNTLNGTISSLNEHIRRTQLDYLDNAFQQQKSLAAECLDGIDDQLIKLSVYVEEYQRLRASLKELSQNKIPEMGGAPPAMPEALGGDTLAAILAERIDYLKSHGKI
jgi:hypothetical protein